MSLVTEFGLGKVVIVADWVGSPKCFGPLMFDFVKLLICDFMQLLQVSKRCRCHFAGFPVVLEYICQNCSDLHIKLEAKGCLKV